MTTDPTRWQIRNSLMPGSSLCPTTVTWVGSALPAHCCPCTGEKERAGGGRHWGLRLDPTAANNSSKLPVTGHSLCGVFLDEPICVWLIATSLWLHLIFWTLSHVNMGGRMVRNVQSSLWPDMEPLGCQFSLSLSWTNPSKYIPKQQQWPILIPSSSKKKVQENMTEEGGLTLSEPETSSLPQVPGGVEGKHHRGTTKRQNTNQSQPVSPSPPSPLFSSLFTLFIPSTIPPPHHSLPHSSLCRSFSLSIPFSGRRALVHG